MPNVGMHGRVGEPAAVVALDVVAAAVVASHVGVVQSHGSDEPGQPPAAEPGQPPAANSDVLVSALAGTLSAGMPLGLSVQYSAVMGEPTAIGQ